MSPHDHRRRIRAHRSRAANPGRRTARHRATPPRRICASCRGGRFLGYFLGLGTWGFGGPIATVGYMQRDLVERRRWLTREDFLDGVALSQSMPGPLAALSLNWHPAPSDPGFQDRSAPTATRSST